MAGQRVHVARWPSRETAIIGSMDGCRFASDKRGAWALGHQIIVMAVMAHCDLFFLMAHNALAL